MDRPVVSQPYYSAMKRMPEVEHFPTCHYYALGIVPYSPLARGVLTGKYRPICRRQGHPRKAQRHPHDATEWRPESLQLAQEIKRHAEAGALTARQFAVARGLELLAGQRADRRSRTEQQRDDYLRALDYHLPPRKKH